MIAAATMLVGFSWAASAQSESPVATEGTESGEPVNDVGSSSAAEGDSSSEPLPAPVASAPAPPEAMAAEASNWQWTLIHRTKLTGLGMPDKLPAEVDPLWTELEYRPRGTLSFAPRLQLIAEPLLRAASSWGERGTSDGRFTPFADRQRAHLKELLVRFTSASVDATVGWQVYSWGKGDGIKPLDVLQVSDQTDRIRDEVFGTPSLSVTAEHSDWSAELVWVPVRTYSVVSYSSRNVWAVAPRDVGLPWRFAETMPDNMQWDKGEAAARISYAGEGFDLAVMGALGRDHAPSVFALRPVQEDPSAALPTLVLSPLFSRFGMLGATGAFVHDSNILRLDFGVFDYADDGKSPYVKSGVRGVVGYERQISFADGTAQLRAIVEYAYDSTTPSSFGSSGSWMSSPFRLFRHAALGAFTLDVRQRLSLQVKGFVDIVRGAWISRLSLSYRPKDGLCLWIGADLLDGRNDSPLGYVSSADRVLVALEFTTQ